jgi:hypothetical protein
MTSQEMTAYMATVDPFHGDLVPVDLRTPGQALPVHPWTRRIPDTLGRFDADVHAPGHHFVPGDGRLDFAASGYPTPGYHRRDDLQVDTFVAAFAQLRVS